MRDFLLTSPARSAVVRFLLDSNPAQAGGVQDGDQEHDGTNRDEEEP